MKKLPLLILFICSFTLNSFITIDNPQTAQNRFLLAGLTEKKWYFVKMNMNGILFSSDSCSIASSIKINQSKIISYSPCDSPQIQELDYQLENNVLKTSDMSAEIVEINEYFMCLRIRTRIDESALLDTNLTLNPEIEFDYFYSTSNPN